MANESEDTLSHIMSALADPTRRAVVTALADGPLPVSVLAGDHDMALPSFLKHIDKLERAGILSTRKTGRVRTCHLQPGGLRPVKEWLSREERRWAGGLDRLAAHLDAIQKGPKQ
ncbi:ArsR/SmtB family transcription factor [Tateyamaria sp. SN3-11]|uniref:ArsR/SmtB family transcription factor n=1 Tax=Tateyamaria sp. SN3-11 TaxID=3092147 RepID=UPI0039E8C4A4